MARETSVDWPWPGEWESVEDVSNFYKDELYEALCNYVGGLAQQDSHIDYVAGPFTIGNLTIGSVLFASTGGIISQDNDDFFWDATNIRLGINVGTSPSVTLDVGGDCKFDGAVTINDAGADKDTRIEGLNDTELLFVDASTDRVGISTTTPTTTFNVAGDTDLDGSVIINEANADKDFRVEGSGATYTHLLFTDASTNRVGINLSSPLCLAHVRGAVCADYAGINADAVLLLENDGNVALALQAATTGSAYVEFCDDAYNPPAGRVAYDFANEQMEFIVGTVEHMWLTTTLFKVDVPSIEVDGTAAASFIADSHDADAYYSLEEDNVVKWTVGFDYTDSLKFKISEGLPGTNTIVEIQPTTRNFDLMLDTAQLRFMGSTGDKGILYNDTGSAARYAMRFPSGSNVVEILNRAASGTVEIHANTSTAGAGGDVNVVTVDDTDVTLSDGIGFNLQEDITFTGATTVNQIKFPDNLPVALDFLEDVNSYLKFVSTNGSESVTFGKTFSAITGSTIGTLTLADGSITDSSGAVSFGDENLTGSGTLSLINSSVNTTADFEGIRAEYVKTAGVTDADDHLIGLNVISELNQSGGIIGYQYGGTLYARMRAGDVGDASNAREISGMAMVVDLNAGKVWGNARGFNVIVDQEAAHEVTAHMQGIYVRVDADGTLGGNAYMLYLDEKSNIDYGIYQSGTAINYFGGNTGVGQATFGTNAIQTSAWGTGVAPTTSPADCFQMYSADIGGAAGKAGAHFRDEEGNVVSIGSGGVLMSGTARVKKEIVLSTSYLERGSTAPDVVISGNYLTWSYDVGDDSVMTHIVPNDWASGTDIVVKVHWFIDEAYASDKEVKWQCVWALCPHDETEAVDAPTHTDTLTATSQNIPATAKHLTETTIGTIAAADISVGDEIGLTLSRIAQDNDAPTADPQVVHLDVIYTVDKLGESI